MKRALLLTICVFAGGLAQPRGGPPNADRVLDMILALRISRMTQELGLSDQQIATILPKLRERDSVDIAYRQEQAADLKSLEAELSKRSPSERRIGEIIRRMQERERSYQAELTRIRNEIMSVLSVEQQARFIVFEVRFEREIQLLINRIKGRHGAGTETHREDNQLRRTE